MEWEMRSSLSPSGMGNIIPSTICKQLCLSCRPWQEISDCVSLKRSLRNTTPRMHRTQSVLMSFTWGSHRTFPLHYCAHNRRPEARWGIAHPPCRNRARNEPSFPAHRHSAGVSAGPGPGQRGGADSAPAPRSPRAGRDGGAARDGRGAALGAPPSGGFRRWHSRVTVRSPSVLAPGAGWDRGMAQLVLQAPHGVFRGACPEGSRVSALLGRWHTDPRAGTKGGTRPPPPRSRAPEGPGGRAAAGHASARCFRT